jgi:hypothetical protein
VLVMAWLFAGCGGSGGSSTTAGGGLATVTAPEITVPAGQAGGGGARTSTAAATTTAASQAPAQTTAAAEPARKLPPGKSKFKSPKPSAAERKSLCEAKASGYPPAQRDQFIAQCINPSPPAPSELPPAKRP